MRDSDRSQIIQNGAFAVLQGRNVQCYDIGLVAISFGTGGDAVSLKAAWGPRTRGAGRGGSKWHAKGESLFVYSQRTGIEMGNLGAKPADRPCSCTARRVVAGACLAPGDSD